VESVNEELYHNLAELVRLPFFKYFRVCLYCTIDEHFFIFCNQVDLYRPCPFWPDDGSCNNIGCAITTVDEVCRSAVYLICLTSLKSNIPVQWRASTLSKVDENTTSDKVGWVYRHFSLY
jgi:ERO1-like protein beta